ncbi:response regulator transcription factor [Pseudomonas chlororaphis]|uniref:response regulator transcription factor n=1 Tax=Pseudomonas chlororaphis TaxID=587753 RepID=UPI0015DF5212|nr:response regulator transcription factor [Pseudomonas chlororaphis]QLL11390.1 response regulator transcription factor [Pseudomonas chlororaphis subsp. aurantiaca]
MGNIVIVDDHPLIRVALKVILQRNGHYIAAEADNGVEAIQLVRTHKPDLVILDLDLPQLDGLSVLTYFKANNFLVKTLILTSSDPKNFAVRCLHEGAAGFICKDEALNEVGDAVKALLSGHTYFPETSLAFLQKSLSANQSTSASQLTNREITTLRLLAQGLNNREIADTLLISYKTVSTYKIRLLKKFNTTNLLALVEIARQKGII